MKFHLLLLLLVATSTTCLCQESGGATQSEGVNLAGTWVLDASKSKGVDESAKMILRISQTGSEIRIKTSSESGENERVTTLYTDGRPGSSSTNNADHPIAKWSGKTLIVKSTLTSTELRAFDGGPTVTEMVEEWELSKDGKTLLCRTTLNDPKPPPRLDTAPDGSLVARPGRKTFFKLTLAYKRFSQ